MLCMLSHSDVSDSFVTPWSAAHQAPLTMGTVQATILEWVATPSSRGSSQPRDQIQVSHIAGRFFTIWASREALALCSVQFSCSVMSNFLQPHGLQHTRLPCPSPTPGACSNSCPSQWCHPTSSSCVVAFSSCLQFLSIRVFSNESVLRISWPKYWPASVLPINIQDWFPLGLTGLISL